MQGWCRLGRGVVLAAVSGACWPAFAEPAIRFDHDIRPILSEHCYACHGPGEQEAGLRLDSAEAATAELDSGSLAIVAGDAGASEMVARIREADPDLVMPPPHTNKPLSDAQKDLLVRWIEAGAAYEVHWSFRSLERPSVPEAVDPAGTNPVDRFIEARLAEESRLAGRSLPLNVEADRPTLLRRLSFALTGLPPTPSEVDAFVADTSPDAYSRQVERLLQSPHHGEEMARHWLDVARYADTHGLHLDNERQMWAYRDWVVEAFNDNLPFDAFTIWQVAGDLLPDATLEQKVATGFSRCNVTTSEGGSINDELLFRYAVDRTATMTNAFLGLTGQCAVCHDHKFDPLSQKEFYSLYAFFNSAADPGFDGNKLLTPPVMKVPTRPQQEALASLQDRQDHLERALDAAIAAVEYVDPATLDPAPEPQRLETVWLDDEFPPGAVVKSSGRDAQPTAWFAGSKAEGVFAGQQSLERTAFGMGQDYYESGAAAIAVRPDDDVFAHVWLDPANPPKSVMIQFRTDNWKHRAVWGNAESIPWGKPGTGERYHAGPLPETGSWVRLTVPAAAMGLTTGMKITGFALTQYDGHARWDLVGAVSINDPAADPSRSLRAWWAERTGRKKLDELPRDLRELVRAGPEKTTDTEDVARIRRHWLTKEWSERPDALLEATAAVEAARKARAELEKSIPSSFVFADSPKMRESFVMQRGAYDSPGDKVPRATPAFLPDLDVAEGTTPDRLDLARWLVADSQPLTPRVAANRLWQQFFGTGLVKTSEDFGLQGEPPSHPQLLDWLAAEYRESGWDTRHMVKLLVTSRAFRRASGARPEQLAADPENRLLARGPRFRLAAEQIRDNALAVSGLLVRTMGGRGVNPYQPPDIWEPVGFGNSNTRSYKQDSGEALYRRTLYTFFKRTAPHPALVNFDAPNREQFCSRRERSNTPLQALQLMNDIQHVEAARALAARTLVEAEADDAARIEWLFRVVLARRPTAEESGIVADTLADNRARYEADVEAAKLAIAHGESKPPADLLPAELAAWTLLANMMLNLDETVTRN